MLAALGRVFPSLFPQALSPFLLPFFQGPTDGPAPRGVPVFRISLLSSTKSGTLRTCPACGPHPGGLPRLQGLSPLPTPPSRALTRSLWEVRVQVTCWGRLGHREPDVKTTGQQRWVARHSAPAWVLDPPLPLPPSLRDVPSGLASGCGSEGNMLSVGCGWRRTDRLSCQLCVGKREVPLPAGPPQDASRRQSDRDSGHCPLPLWPFSLWGPRWESQRVQSWGSDPGRVFMDLGSGPWKSPH